MKRALVVPANGIGDALLMMIASHQLKKAGFEVTTCHPALRELKLWFPGHHFTDHPPLELTSFDQILVENNNSPEMHIWKLNNPQTSIFYPSYCPRKNPPLSSNDHIFNPEIPMAENIAIATSVLLETNQPPSKENGITPREGLIHKRYPKRVVIHPTSSALSKNWLKQRYLKLSHQLRNKGFQPVFALSPKEKRFWKEDSFPLNTLDDLATLIYESGYMIGNDSLVGHLASNLGLPTLIIADDKKRMNLWRPGWFSSIVITPYNWIPNTKFLRLRTKKWKHLISAGRVLSTFEKLYLAPKHTFPQ